MLFATFYASSSTTAGNAAMNSFSPSASFAMPAAEVVAQDKQRLEGRHTETGSGLEYACFPLSSPSFSFPLFPSPHFPYLYFPYLYFPPPHFPPPYFLSSLLLYLPVLSSQES